MPLKYERQEFSEVTIGNMRKASDVTNGNPKEKSPVTQFGHPYKFPRYFYYLSLVHME